jgi:hypothetical protein
MPCLAQTKIESKKDHDLIERFFRASTRELIDRGLTFDHNDFNNYSEAITSFEPSTLTTFLPKSPLFFQNWLSEYLLDLIEAYLGCTPYLVEAYIRRNFPAKFKVMNHYWHRDTNNKLKLIKAFFFLSDCEVWSGPHEYIKRSHKDFSYLNSRSHYHDDEVDQLFPLDSEQRIKSTVKAGTVILEDTRGLHRAKLPDKGYRDLGYAVFFPIAPWQKFTQKYYEINNKTYKTLNPRQKITFPNISFPIKNDIQIFLSFSSCWLAFFLNRKPRNQNGVYCLPVNF